MYNNETSWYNLPEPNTGVSFWIFRKKYSHHTYAKKYIYSRVLGYIKLPFLVQMLKIVNLNKLLENSVSDKTQDLEK